MDEMHEYVERSEGQRGEDPPVTGVASRRVEPGREEEFEDWTSASSPP
jgi:antibiotic biosynthesis monooxygenase (ABM) superfamily enzyme